METVGAILKAERERKGLTIKDIEQGTSIRALYLTAIEEDRYEVVPGEVYLKGFIRNYAGFLGLNGPQLVEIYRQTRPDYAPPIVEEASTQSRRSTQEKLKSQRSSSPKWLAVVLIIVCAAGIAIYAANRSTPSNPSTPQADPKVQTQVPQASTPAPVTPPQPLDQPIVVLARFSDNCWVSVTADGKVIYEGTAKNGEQLTWNAQKTLVVKAGNAGAVDITFNNQPQGKLGGRGEVAQKTFAAPGSAPKP